MSSNVAPLEQQASRRVPVEVKEVIDDEVNKDVIEEGTFPSAFGSAPISEANYSTGRIS
ncbi:hypothetical protein NXC12_PA00057 (plasmid) [Rhizobium etli]|uniref:Uncharacterized protein n=1 Tax=Rhizobium etli TaxID=29449 RepID=A0AAN1BJC6_RHIET|nr:hypothetical protein NXC12_PA00057 [Rhizobium etli]